MAGKLVYHLQLYNVFLNLDMDRFFASYHGYRKALHTYYPQPMENNIMAAAVLSLTPLVVLPTLRMMVPYSVMLIALDCINGINDL